MSKNNLHKELITKVEHQAKEISELKEILIDASFIIAGLIGRLESEKELHELNGRKVTKDFDQLLFRADQKRSFLIKRAFRNGQ